MKASSEEMFEGESLKKLNTWRIGGQAQYLLRPPNLDVLQAALRAWPLDRPVTWLGLGSNVLVPDEGLEGLVIVTQGGLSHFERAGDLFYAQAGVPCAKLARFSAREGYEGGEFFAGIPGTVGGALAMNAGAFGTETWSCVESVQMIDREGNITERSPEAFSVAYRSVQGPAGWFLGGTFRLTSGDGEAAFEKIRAFLDQRKTTQPTGDYTCGSVFKNPDGDYAGRLIEACGLKGHCVGGAQVSDKHANFIVNRGNATADDVRGLINFIQDEVQRKFGIRLQTEVRFLGD